MVSQKQLQLPSNVAPGNQPTHPQLPIQPNPNPNNKGAHQADVLNLPSYSISTAELYERNLQSGWTINIQPPRVIIKQLDSEIREAEPVNEEPNQIDRTQTLPVKQHHSEPPYPKRLIMSKRGHQYEFDLLGKLQNLLVKFPCYKL